MVSFPLLSNVRHRAMITPVSPLWITAVEPVLELHTPTLPPSIRIFWLRPQHLEALAPDPEQFGPKNKKNIVLFA